MGYAEKIYERVKCLPDPVAEEVLDFAEFVAGRRQSEAAPVGKDEQTNNRARVEQIFAKYQLDLSEFKFDREEANVRR